MPRAHQTALGVKGWTVAGIDPMLDHLGARKYMRVRGICHL
jgi:hypothetical protein